MAFSGSAVFSGSALGAARGGAGRAVRLRFRAVALAVALALLLLRSGPALALAPGPWLLPDQAGHSWSLTLLEQADPAYPGGLRLRLTDRSGSRHPDHRRPLQLSDPLGGSWELPNRSQELVPAGSPSLPPGSAQFDLAALEPRPRAELPLRITVPLESGGVATLTAGPEAVAGLHGAALHGAE